MRILPRDFYDMDVDDAALMFKGWQEQLLHEQATARLVTGVLGDVMNRSMGGKGILKDIEKIWPLPGDRPQTSEDALMKKLARRLNQQKKKGG